MKKYLWCLSLCLILLCVVQPAFAQSKQEAQALKKEIESLKQGQTVIGQDVQEIKKLLQGMQRPATAPPAPPVPFTEAIIDIKGAPIKGDKNAKFVMIEFTEYECPFCGKYARETQPQISKEYIETGKMRQVFMDFPLAMHRRAPKASEAGLCAADQGKFWEMSDKLFDNPTNNPTWLEPENILKIAEGLGLDMTAFKACLDGGKRADDVKKRMAVGQKAGMTGTPAFYLGYMMPDGTVKATKQLKGAMPFASFKAAIDEMLAPKKADEKPAPKK